MCLRLRIRDLHHQVAAHAATLAIDHLKRDRVEHLVITRRVVLAQAGRVVQVGDLAGCRVVAGQLDVALAGRHSDRRSAQRLELGLGHRRACHHDAGQPLGRLDREVTFHRLVFAHGVLSGSSSVQVRNVDRRRNRRRSRTTIPPPSRQRRNQQQRQPPQRHRRHARAQRLPGLHPIGQHAHRIRAHRTLRHIRVHIAVLVRAHQQVVTAFAVANLAVVLVVVLDHQVRLVHVATFKGNVQVLAHPLGRHVLRAIARGLVREVVLHVGQRLDAHALALRSRSAFAPCNAQALHGFAGTVDVDGDVLQAHDLSLFPLQLLIGLAAGELGAVPAALGHRRVLIQSDGTRLSVLRWSGAHCPAAISSLQAGPVACRTG